MKNSKHSQIHPTFNPNPNPNFNTFSPLGPRSSAIRATIKEEVKAELSVLFYGIELSRWTGISDQIARALPAAAVLSHAYLSKVRTCYARMYHVQQFESEITIDMNMNTYAHNVPCILSVAWKRIRSEGWRSGIWNEKRAEVWHMHRYLINTNTTPTSRPIADSKYEQHELTHLSRKLKSILLSYTDILTDSGPWRILTTSYDEHEQCTIRDCAPSSLSGESLTDTSHALSLTWPLHCLTLLLW